jgi:tetratricopeptide (TPR) repeat protein
MSRRFCKLALLLSVVAALTVIWGCGHRSRKPVEGEKVLTHVVESGETLETIADDYYGNPERAPEIGKFNLLETDELTQGDVVRIYMAPDDMEALVQRKKARVPYNTGLDMVRRGAYVDAIAEFQKSVELDPDFAEAIYNLGVTYQKLDSHEKAIEQFEVAVKMRSENADYYYAMGNSYFHLERYDPAVRSFERALSANPNYLKAQYSMAVALEKSGNMARARREWHRYLDMDSDSEWADRARARLAELEQ